MSVNYDIVKRLCPTYGKGSYVHTSQHDAGQHGVRRLRWLVSQHGVRRLGQLVSAWVSRVSRLVAAWRACGPLKQLVSA